MQASVKLPSLTVAVWLNDYGQQQWAEGVLAKYHINPVLIGSHNALVEALTEFDILILSETEMVIDDVIKFFQAQKISKLVGIIFCSEKNNFVSSDDTNLAIEFCPWPCSEDVFRFKLLTLKSLLYRDKQLHEKETELLNYHTLILQEQAIAKNIFSELLHSEVIHLPGLYFSLSPMSVYNGDVLLAEKVNNTLYIMLGDFTGHGLPAAIGSIPTSEIFYAMVRKQKSIANIAAEINSKLKKLLPSSMFCAACIISYETQKHELSIWQGGLPTGYLMHEDGEKITELNSIHLPLGILSAGDFESDIQQFQLEKTSKLVFMTDGYIEMKNAEGKVLAKEAIIKEIINKKTNQQISALQNLLQQHMKSEQLLDDVAIMSMELCV